MDFNKEMNKGMNKIKATLNLAPKTHDDDYEHRKAALKDLVDGVHAYKAAMTKVQASMKSAMEALGQVNKAFDKLANSGDEDVKLQAVAKNFSDTYHRFDSEYYVEYNKSMNADVIGGVNTLKTLYEECIDIETERSKMRSEYDVYREEVSKKEADYAKKGKDLSTSKNYTASVEKRDEFKKQFEAQAEKFKKTHDELTRKKVSTLSACMNSFFVCSQKLYKSMSSDFATLHGVAAK